jgi:hypothetical protein
MTWTWEPISREELEKLIRHDLAETSEEERAFYETVRTEPEKWRLTPWGDEGGGFWVVAVKGNQVIWYNDIEDGFNESRFVVHGEIPEDEYWCNQEELGWVLPRLRGEPGTGYKMSGPRAPRPGELEPYLPYGIRRPQAEPVEAVPKRGFAAEIVSRVMRLLRPARRR